MKHIMKRVVCCILSLMVLITSLPLQTVKADGNTDDTSAITRINPSDEQPVKMLDVRDNDLFVEDRKETIESRRSAWNNATRV